LRIRILQIILDPTGSGSDTLLKTEGSGTYIIFSFLRTRIFTSSVEAASLFHGSGSGNPVFIQIRIGKTCWILPEGMAGPLAVTLTLEELDEVRICPQVLGHSVSKLKERHK